MALPDDPTPAAVELRSVSKRFGGRVILDRVDLHVRPGEFFALLGPSGSGKSTLLKTVSGIDVPDEGQVLLRGRDVSALPPYRRPVHTVFQNYSLFPHLDVAGNVGFPLRVAGVQRAEREKRVRRALEWVHLGAFAGRRVDGLSGGERQRVAVARALVDEPECVLLDEPLSALDPHLRGQTLDLLQEVQSRLHVTYLYVTHDREEALRAAHRLAVLNRGRLEQVGTPEEVYHSPASAFVAGFVGPISWFRGEATAANGRPALRLTSGVVLPQGRPVVPAGTVVLGVRPEVVRLVPAGGLAARVVQRQFAGATVSLQLDVAGVGPLRAEVRTETDLPAAGEAVRVEWSAPDTHVFADPEAAP